MKHRALLHDDDVVVVFEATQEARHGAMLEANGIAKQLVDVARARAAGQPPDEDGVYPEPGRLRVIVGFEHADITTKQRGFLHAAVLPQIAEQYVFPDGTRFAAEIWKEHFRKRFLPDVFELKREPRWDHKLGRMVLPKRATPHRVRVSTESLGTRAYSEFIDQVIAAATTELGVVFEFRPSERDAVRYRKPVRRQPAPKTKHMGPAEVVQPLALPAPSETEPA